MLIKQILAESIDVEPGVMEIDAQGQKTISWPREFSRREMVKCKYCEGGTDSDGYKCDFCHGKGETLSWVYDFPTMNVSNMTMGEVLAPMLGLEFDHVGFVPHEQLPNLRRTLIRIKNGGEAGFTRDPSVEQNTIVDRSGDIPTIRRGATMIDFGVSPQMIQHYADRLLTIIDWAQKNNCGLRWG